MSTVKQIDLTLINTPGQLYLVSDMLGENRIKIIGCYFTSQEKEVNFHFIASDPDKAINVLRAAGYEIGTKEVIACEIPNHPGGLTAMLRVLKDADINIDYIYSCFGTGDNTVVILGVEAVEKALKVMEDNWIRVIGSKLYHI